MSVEANLNEVQNQLTQGVTLVAVSKTYSPEVIMQAYASGQRSFGENRVQDLQEKYDALPKDIEWHQIGHLQKNKVKYIAPFVSLIHAVDSIELLEVIDKEGAKNNRRIYCLIQLHIAEEDSKFGFAYKEAKKFFEAFRADLYPNVLIKGLMGMATFTDDEAQIRKEFRNLKSFYDLIKESFFQESEEFTTLSMGMSADYKIAIEEGSNLVRVGSAIFGSR